MSNTTKKSSKFPSISPAGYKALCQFCDETTILPYSIELERLVDAALVLIHSIDERRNV